jgi:hypothetical protein
LEEHNASIFRDKEQAKQASKQSTNQQEASRNKISAYKLALSCLQPFLLTIAEYSG